MKPTQMRDYIIKPTLEWMGEDYYKKGAVTLLMATFAQESHCGQYVHQVGGPALGIGQVEPGTHQLVKNWMRRESLDFPKYGDEELIYDLRYNTMIARLLYYSWPDRLPDPYDRKGNWLMYKKCYNSYQGAATYRQFKRNWRKFVKPTLRKP